MHNLKSSGFFSFPAEVSITPSNMWGGQGLLGNTVNLINKCCFYTKVLGSIDPFIMMLFMEKH